MRNNLVRTICECAEKDKDIIIVTGDLGYNVLNVFYDKYPEQYINAGISEQNMTSVAAGLALEGKCVFTYSIGNFSTLRCLEQIRNDICYHNANVKVIALAAGFAYGSLGMSHHATEDIACMRAMPDMVVFSPCDPLETIAVTKASIAYKGPCYIRLGRGGEPNLRESFANFEIGKAYPIFEGNDGVIFSTGAITKEAILAVKELEKQRIHIALYTFPTIKPIDKETILRCAKKYKFIISLEEHDITGGFGGAIAEVLCEIPGDHAILKRVGLDNVFTSVVGDTDYLRKYYHLDSSSLINDVKGLLHD